MSKAPEWIYLDGDVEAGDGVFPRCFEDPKHASEPPIEYGRIDILEAAEQRAYAEAMEAERKRHEGRIEELEAKLAKTEGLLAKAVEELEWCIESLEYDYQGTAEDYGIPDSVRTTLAELKEKTDE